MDYYYILCIFNYIYINSLIINKMKKIKQQLAYAWKHKEAVLAITLIFIVIFFGLLIIEQIIDKGL